MLDVIIRGANVIDSTDLAAEWHRSKALIIEGR